MDRRQMCVSNVQYHKPSAAGGAKNLLGYLTYREGRFEGVKQRGGKDRWVDRGMGKSVKEVAQCCQQMQSEHVLLFSLVINPNPDLIAMIPPDQRETFVKQLTEKVVEGFFEARGIDTGIEFSYVLHHRETDDPQAPGQHNPHTHVVLPGTVFSESDDQRVPLYFSQNKKVDHIEMLHRVTEAEMAPMLDHAIGMDWEEHYDDLVAVREQQRAITDQPAQGTFREDGLEIPYWCGERQLDEERSDVGIYRAVEDGGIEFRPLVQHLNHEDSALLARLMEIELGDDFARIQELVAQMNAFGEANRDLYFAEVRHLRAERALAEHAQSDRSPMLERTLPLDRNPMPDRGIDF